MSTRCRGWSTSSCSCAASGPPQTTVCSCSRRCASTPASGSPRDEHAAEIHRRHCGFYLALAERAEPDLFTWSEGAWLPKLDAEVENFRAALEWSLSKDPSLALRLAGLLSKFWEIRSRYAEGLESVEAALEAAGPDAQVGDRARARRAHAELHTSTGSTYDWQGSMEESRALAADALALSRQAGHGKASRKPSC